MHFIRMFVIHMYVILQYFSDYMTTNHGIRGAKFVTKIDFYRDYFHMTVKLLLQQK